MAYVINEPCIGMKDSSCVEVCPVDCIHPTPDEPDFEAADQLYIDPEECIDCDACVEACPVDAITPEDMVPAGVAHIRRAATPPTTASNAHRVEYRSALKWRGSGAQKTTPSCVACTEPARRFKRSHRNSAAPRMPWRGAAGRSACASGERHGLGRNWRRRFSVSQPRRACRPRPWRDAFSVPWKACASGAGSSGSVDQRRVAMAPMTTPCFARGGRPARTSRRWRESWDEAPMPCDSMLGRLGLASSAGPATMDVGRGRERPRWLRRRSSLRGDRCRTARAQHHGGRGTGAKARAGYVCSALDARGGRAPPWPSGDPPA